MSKVQIGSKFNLGTGHDGSEDYEVVGIKNDVTQGLLATLELIEFGGPLETLSVSYLETLKQVER